MDRKMVLIKSLVIAPRAAASVSRWMLRHPLWIISASIRQTLDASHLTPPRPELRRTLIMLSAVSAAEGRVAGLSCPISVPISLLRSLMWTGPSQWMLIMLSVFSLQSFSLSSTCCVSSQMHPPQLLKPWCLCLHNPLWSYCCSICGSIRCLLKPDINTEQRGAVDQQHGRISRHT